MSNFFPARGCVYAIGGAQRGFYRFGDLSGSAQSPILITGSNLSVVDSYQPVATIQDFKVIYSFGSGFGGATVTGEVLLGEAGSGGGDGFSKVVSFFKGNRLSVKRTPVPLSLPGGESYMIYIVGLQVWQPDPEFHVQPFAFSGIVAEPN